MRSRRMGRCSGVQTGRRAMRLEALQRRLYLTAVLRQKFVCIDYVFPLGRQARRGDGLDFDRSRVRERGEHLRNGLPYMAKAFGEELGISVPQLDVIACGRTGFEPDGMADYERGGFCFGFADSA